jgi:hypothetical protein
MDMHRFDSFTRRRAPAAGSRRRLLALGAGLGLLTYTRLPDIAEASCRKNGHACGPSGDRSCCSGTCRRGKCKRTPGAKGCTVRHDYCKLDMVTCPNHPSGYCFMRNNGKPFCGEEAICSNCLSDGDCVEWPDGKCIQNCGFCTGGSGAICVYPKGDA